ncbi:MAG: phosphate signaling complex protein PhoU [Bacteroidota bacterium]
MPEEILKRGEGTQSPVFHHQQEELHRLLLQMATLSEEMLGKALEALQAQNTSRAQVVIVKDREVDALEVTIDKHILEMLALQQPVAADLRSILSAQKINNDLERVADHAVNIAEAAIILADAPMIKPLVHIPRMGVIARDMLKEAIDSFVYGDSRLAAAVKQRDDEMDGLHRQVTTALSSVVEQRPNEVRRALALFGISIDLERVADLATNIAEEVIFIQEAEVVKHKEGKT